MRFGGGLVALATRRLGLGAERQAERAPFGVSTDRPPSPGMDHASAQGGDLLKRALHLSNSEVRQRGRVAWADATLVNAEHGSLAGSLPSATFRLTALVKLNAE
jgi:hypothetical protein